MLDTPPKSQEERAALRERNMESFRNHKISMATRLAAHVPATTLEFDETGQPDVVFHGEKFYDGDYYAFVEKQIADFKRMPRRFALQIPQPKEFDRIGGAFMSNFLKRATIEVDAEFSAGFPDLETFFVTVLGIGLGGHLPKLTEISKCSVMFIVDPNIETLYHSLEILDWEELFLSCESRGGRIEFLIGDDASGHFHNIRSLARWTNAPSIDGMLLYVHYNNPMFNQVLGEVRKQSSLFLAGLGFFDDETKMLENTHANLKGGTAHIYTKHENPLVTPPCFIIGCGPSLDSDLPNIKKLADKAIIISSGSALGPLLNAGIRPDYQLEVENEGILPIMRHVAEVHDISDICLVTSSTVEPEIVDYFKRIIYHFRPALSPFHIYSDANRNTISFHDPSVVNSSLGFALEQGFRNFYFFGCDMGTMDSERHHAQGSYHFEDDAVLPDNDFCIKVPANFGGDTYTSSGLFWVKSNIENAMAANIRGRTFYNCSDGAFLNGAISKFSKSIVLPEPEDPNFKESFVRKSYEDSPIMDKETFESLWNRDQIRDATNKMLDHLRDIISEAAFLIDKSYLIEINTILYHSPTALERGIATWLRGTIQMMLLATEFYGTRLRGKETAIGFEEIVCEELIRSLAEMQVSCMDLIDRLE